MNPNPLPALNHFTVPVSFMNSLFLAMELSGDRLRRATRAAKAYRVGQTDVQSFKDYPIIARMGAAGYGTMSSPLPQQGDLRGDRGQHARQQRSAGSVGGPGGRSKVLAAGADGVEESWRGRHLHRLRGWIERIPGGDRDGVPASSGAAVSGASGTGLAELRIVEAAESGGRGFTVDLSCQYGGTSRAAAGRVRGEVGRDVSDHQPDVAPELGVLDAVLRLSGGHSEGDLHHQRNRVAEYVAAKSDQDSRIVSQSGGRPQAAVPSPGTHRQEVDDAGAELEGRLATLRDSAGRSGSQRGNDVNRRRRNRALWKCQRVETVESERRAFPLFPRRLGNLAKAARFPHFHSAGGCWIGWFRTEQTQKNWCAVEEWKSKSGIPTFPPHRWPAAQGRSMTVTK